ncbi:MAG: zf-HC2 domain-containing protein [Longimicrobiales bacterium]
MNHAGDGLLQAYIDGEVTGEAEAELVAHVSACATCGEDLKDLRGAAATFHDAMSQFDGMSAIESAREIGAAREQVLRTHKTAATPISSARSATRFSRLAAGSLARAAAVLLLVAVGAAAVIPGSPLRRLIGRGVERISAVLAPTADNPTEAAAPVAPVERVLVPGAEMSITPVNGAVRVYVNTTPGAGRLTVRLVDSPLATVQTDSSAHNVTLQNATGRMDILNLGVSDAEIRLPRALRSVLIEVNGRPFLVKENDQLRVLGPTAGRNGDEIVFRTGS